MVSLDDISPCPYGYIDMREINCALLVMYVLVACVVVRVEWQSDGSRFAEVTR